MTDESLAPAKRRNPAATFFGWSVAHGLIRVEEYAFDYVLYPYLLYVGGPALIARHLGHSAPTLGYWLGFAIALVASIIVNLIYVWAYVGLKADLFGIEAAKRIEERGAARWWYRLIRWPVRLSMFIYLSVFHNPLFATIWLRRRPPSTSMTIPDWTVFWWAIAISNIGWALVVSGAVELAVGVYRAMGAPTLPDLLVHWHIG